MDKNPKSNAPYFDFNKPVDKSTLIKLFRAHKVEIRKVQEKFTDFLLCGF